MDVCFYIDISKYNSQNVKERNSYELDGENLSKLLELINDGTNKMDKMI